MRKEKKRKFSLKNFDFEKRKKASNLGHFGWSSFSLIELKLVIFWTLFWFFSCFSFVDLLFLSFRFMRIFEALFSLGIDGIESSRIYYHLIMYFLINNCIKFFNAKFTFIYLFARGVKPLILQNVSVNGIEKKYGRIKGNDVRHSCVGRRLEIFQWGLAFFSQTARFYTSLHGRRYS